MKTTMLAIAIAAGLAGTQAAAQQAPGAAPSSPAAPSATAPTARGRMQADRTREQAQQMADAMFARFDANHDGLLTRDEAQQALADSAADRGGDGDGSRAQRMLDRMFGGAVSVTLAQFENQALTRFDREDVNHDGVVTAAERRQGWAKRAQ